MNARALYLPEHHGIARWSVAAIAIVLAHLGLVGGIAYWYAYAPTQPNIIPAIAVSFAPTQASAPEVQDQDLAIGPTTQQSEPTPPEPPKVVQEEKPIEQTPPPPPVPAAVTLPKPEPKPKPIEKPTLPPKPVTETRVLPKSERIAPFSVAASNEYNSLVFGHLQRYKRYPADAGSASGTVVLRFALNRAGDVVSSGVSRSSGNATLDEAALAILRRANPFPAFPATKPGSQDSFLAPVSFSR